MFHMRSSSHLDELAVAYTRGLVVDGIQNVIQAISRNSYLHEDLAGTERIFATLLKV
jgi:hypothetical protein